MMGADNLRADPIRSPWDARGLPADAVEIRMVAPRSAMPPAGRYMLLALGIAGALLSLRFLMLGAWPVLLFSVLDIGALAIALHMFDRSAVPEERLRVRDNEIELVRSDHRRREKRIVLPALPVGERAEILRRRPDVLAAERRLAASTADIGVATAELFPKLSIGAGGGFQALSPDDWFDGSSARFSILPLISWRLFDGGRVRAEIRAREAGQRQAALGYEQAVLAALGDAERALSDYDAGLDTVARRQAALEASRRSLGHAEARFAAGDIARIELLAAQRLLHEAETAYARAHAATAVQLVAVYKAIGGGWNLSDAPSSAPVS